MEVRTLSYELQRKAIKELNEEPNRVQEDLEQFYNWLQKQQHLTVRLDNQFLLSFLRGCKWSLQKTKEKIDNYYTVRSFIPELFTNKDPFLPDIQNVLKAGMCHPLPCTTNSVGPTLLYLNVLNAHPEEISLEALCKVFFMTMEILLKENDNFTVSGFTLIGNYEKAPLTYFLQFTPGLMKKCVICITRAYPVRVKTFVAINTPSVFETIMNTMIKPFLSKKLKQRVHVFNSNDSVKLYDIVDKSLLPQELGGHHGSIHKAAELWKEKVESYRDWFLEDSKYGSNEKLRVGPPKTYDDSFGMDGTFRKLDID